MAMEVCARVRNYMSKPEQLIITGSFGGTHIRWGVMSNRGKMISKVDLPTNSFESQDQLVTTLTDKLGDLYGSRDARFGGIGVPCPINEELGEPSVSKPANVSFGFQGFFAALSARIGKPIYPYNDAQVDAMGEAMFGAGRWSQYVIFHGLGTGYGVGLVLRNEAYQTEFGHAPAINLPLALAEKERACGCNGHWNCVEQYAAGGSFPATNQLLGGARMSAEDVGKAFLGGEARATEVVKLAMTSLAYHISVIKLGAMSGLHVIGGGISQIGEPLMVVLREQLETLHSQGKVAWPNLVPKVALAELPNDAGLLGAGVLAEQTFDININI